MSDSSACDDRGEDSDTLLATSAETCIPSSCNRHHGDVLIIVLLVAALGLNQTVLSSWSSSIGSHVSILGQHPIDTFCLAICLWMESTTHLVTDLKPRHQGTCNSLMKRVSLSEMILTGSAHTCCTNSIADPTASDGATAHTGHGWPSEGHLPPALLVHRPRKHGRG